jgi:hypothetical protein
MLQELFLQSSYGVTKNRQEVFLSENSDKIFWGYRDG